MPRSEPRPIARRRRDTCPCTIIPPHVLARVIEEGSEEARHSALRALAVSERVRERRAVVRRLAKYEPTALASFMCAPQGRRRSVYDVLGGSQGSLPGDLVRGEGDPPVADPAVNEAFDGSGQTYDFFSEVLSRDSIDGNGMELVSTVHFGVDYGNAFWNGSQMVYGDGDDQIIRRGALTGCLDVIGHELTHGVTQFTAGLRYRLQSGANNEHMSDVFGSLVKQRTLGQTADQADWLIGEGILGPSITGTALRSMKEPGTAFEFDTQPGHMDDYVDLPDDGDPRNDHGGVHINSGIPNRAFFLAATAIGGNAWEKAGHIWYRTLTERLGENSNFQETCDGTLAIAAELYGEESSERAAVRDAWDQVGIVGTQ
jgi:Zn-dependent metalloprotease